MSHTELEELIHTRTQQVFNTKQESANGPLPLLSAAQMATYIDHTLLKPEANEVQIRQLCQEARTFTFASVCVNPTWVELCAALLAGSPVKTCTVIGFPLGATLTTVKAQETAAVIAAGAQEVDMVINLGHLKDQRYHQVYTDIAAVVAVAHPHQVSVKVIIETCLLTDAEKVAASVLTEAAGADFVKTSTGFNSGGATREDVRLMRRSIRPTMGLKAAGGVRSSNDALQMIAAGATRLGASAGVKIMQSFGEHSTAAPVAAGATGENY
ncbi:MAG: deoxyribose-phosphate aldolase [Caldilineaceae bacterium]